VDYQLGRLGPLDKSAGLLVGRTYLSGTSVNLVGGDLGVPMSHRHDSPIPWLLDATLGSQNLFFYNILE
jgi:hypothetical protein